MLRGKTLFITGASRGIGLSIALRAARDGANVAIAAKTAEAHPSLPGTVFTAAEEVEKAGGRALPIVCDIRDEDSVASAVAATVEKFGSLDILVNNASAISLTGTSATDAKRFDLMHQVNTRGTFLASKHCVPHLLKSGSGHILNISPPLSLKPKWFAPHTAYSIAKYGMSLCVLGMAAEFRGKIAVNALWPRTAIATAALAQISRDLAKKQARSAAAPGAAPGAAAGAAAGAAKAAKNAIIAGARTPEIMADAAHAVLSCDTGAVSGQFLMDETVLAASGVDDLSQYAMVPGTKDEDLLDDFFLDEDGDWPMSEEARAYFVSTRDGRAKL